MKHVEGAESAGFASLYLVISPEGAENRVALDRLVAKLARREGIEPLGIRTLNRVTARELDQEINTGTLFSQKKIVILGEAHDLEKGVEELILRGTPANTFIILLGLSGANPFYKKLEKQGIVVELGAEKSWEKEKNAHEWVLQRFNEEKKRIEPAAAQLLAKECGGEVGLLEQEIEKLIVYTYGREKVSTQDVLAVAVSRPSITVFQLAESLFKRDTAGAVRHFHALLDEGISFFAILKQLRGQILTDLEVASILRMGGNGQHVTETFPYMKGFILKTT